MKWALLTGVGCLAAALVPAAAQASGLKEYTGYTRPGSPEKSDEGKAKPAATGDEKPLLGATIYFKVYDRSRGKEGDVWGTGLGDLERAFVPGKAPDKSPGSEKLDTAARYLYLYQVVHDSKGGAPLKRLSIRLLVDGALITSYGHFARKEKNEVQGIGFAMEEDAPKAPGGRSAIRPVSTEQPEVKDRRFRNPAPYFLTPKDFELTFIQIGNGPIPIGAGEDLGREPEAVVLRPDADFRDAPNWRQGGQGRDPALSPGERPVTPAADSEPARSKEEAQKSLALEVAWEDIPLRFGQRSTVFAFTSDYPPTYEDVRLSGSPGVRVSALAQVAAEQPVVSADGSVPTPQPIEGAQAAGGGGGVPVGQALSGVGAGGSLGAGGVGSGLGVPSSGFQGVGIGGGTGGGRTSQPTSSVPVVGPSASPQVIVLETSTPRGAEAVPVPEPDTFYLWGGVFGVCLASLAGRKAYLRYCLSERRKETSPS